MPELVSTSGLVPSLHDLMCEAYKLACDLGYSELAPGGYYFTARELPVDERTSDMIWAWVDGLTQKYYENMSTGHCSLQATIDFDPGEFEEDVERDIRKMKKLLVEVGSPVMLTSEEMLRRGYKGY